MTFKWGTVWESPSFTKYVVVHIADDQYILMDYEATCMASTFLKAPKGPIFTEAELIDKLSTFKYIGVRREMIKAEFESVFAGGCQYEKGRLEPYTNHTQECMAWNGTPAACNCGFDKLEAKDGD